MLSRRIIRGRSFLRYLTAAPTVVTTDIKSSSINRFSTSVKSKFDYSYKLNNLYNVSGRYFSTSAVDSQPIDGIVDIPLAQTGEGIAECELLKWFVNEGDEVEEYQPLCEVQSDKATIEITSRYKGTVAKVLHTPGDIIKVGETLLQLTVDDTSISSDASETSLGSETSDADDEKSEFKKTKKGGGLSTPAVRNLAKQHNIDLDDVIGTGKDGRILKEDVLKYAVEKGIIEDKLAIFNPGSIEPMEGPEEKLHEIADSIYHDKTLTLRAYQRAMVKSMTAAASVPHFHYVEELNCDGLVQLKSAFQKANTDPDLKFTFLPILIKSLSLALTTHPLVNSTFNLENYEVTLKGHHNIGIAMATPSGLVVPNIKNVQSLSVLEITKELSRLQKLAMANKLPPADISGGTITLSNIGSIGGKYGSPLINVPEVAIIALGRIQKVAQFKDDGTAYPVSIMTLNNLYNVNGRYFSTSAVDSQPIDGIVDIPLAQTGEGIAECELLKWFVNEGDEVEEYQPLCEVQSDKATIEITSRYKGTVAKVLHTPGDIIKVGETLLQLTVDDTSISSDASETSLGSETSDADDEKSEFKKTKKGGGLSTPAVRNLAKQHNIDLDDVIGTGKDGRILKEDVLKYAVEKGIIEDKPGIFNPGSIEPMEGPEEKLHEIADSIYQDKTLTLRAYQRAMVKSMTAAASVPHFHYVEELNCDGLVQLKSAFQKANTDPDLKFTFLPILIKSLSLALTTHPLVNSTFNLENYEVTLKGHHNIGIAMATPSGLVVPNIKNVQSLSILEITKELSRLQKLAMANKLPPADISGGTITLSNIGSIGGKYGSPLINVPEVAIIALGRIQKVAQFKDDGTAYPVSIMTVNIAADHRILDGANVALFCKDWKLYIENPELLLLHMR